jgi:hypothetical protein
LDGFHGKSGYLSGMIMLGMSQVPYNHVSVAYCLHLEQVVLGCQAIQGTVQAIQHDHHLQQQHVWTKQPASANHAHHTTPMHKEKARRNKACFICLSGMYHAALIMLSLMLVSSQD